MSLLRRILQFLGLVKPVPPAPKEKVQGNQQAFNILKQNVYTMVNTITFSTNMERLYLIDDGRSIEFNLEGNNGILVGTLRGQITVATAFEFPKPDGDAPDEGRGTSIPASLKLETEKTVWSGAFHRKQRVLCLIGATEIEIREPGDKKFDYRPELHFFNIEENTLHIRRKKGDLFVLSIPNSLKGRG